MRSFVFSFPEHQNMEWIWVTIALQSAYLESHPSWFAWWAHRWDMDDGTHLRPWTANGVGMGKTVNICATSGFFSKKGETERMTQTKTLHLHDHLYHVPQFLADPQHPMLRAACVEWAFPCNRSFLTQRWPKKPMFTSATTLHRGLPWLSTCFWRWWISFGQRSLEN